MSCGDLTEVEWRILKDLLPVEREPGKRGRGRPPEDNRNIINGILWRLRTGTPWRDVPEKYGNWKFDLPAFPTMERIGHLGERGNHACRDDGRERPLQHRLHYDPRPCLGSGRKRGIYQMSSWSLAGRVHQ